MSNDLSRHRIHGHEVVYDEATGWRCDCELWEANGWGCVHTLQVFWSESIEQHARDAHQQASRASRLPRLAGPRHLELLTGKIERVVTARELVDIRLHGEYLTLVGRRMHGMQALREGEHVSVVVGEGRDAGYRDVLAIRREGDASPRYTGPFPGRVAGVLSGVAGFAELAAQDWSIALAAAIAIPIALLYVSCLRLRRRVLRQFER